MEPMKIVKEIKTQFGIEISYNKAVKTKTKVLEVMRIHRETLHLLVKELELSGSVGKVGISSDGSQYFFWAFQACIDALRNHLRPVVYVGMEDTQLGVLMYAQGIDGDNVYGWPIEVGFALCVRDDEKSWERFLGWLKEFVLPPQTPPTFTIVTDFEETVTHAVENVLPHVHHFFLQADFKEVFSKKFKDPNIWTLCEQACGSFSAEECESYLQRIKKRNKEAYEWIESVGSKSQWAISFSPNKHARAIGLGTRNNLEIIPILVKKLSIVEIVENSRDMLAKYFSYNRMKGAEMITTTGLTPGVMANVKGAKFCLHAYEVESINRDKYQVTFISSSNDTWLVDLEERSCTCGEFQAKEYPCWHAWVTIVQLNLDVRNYVSQWYTLDTYLATYEGSLPPPIPGHISQWQAALNAPPPKRSVGRPKKRRKN
ncbi:hypothetical protein ACHQM5_007535 [Ranunculus cassubicifolius]